jgi:tetratricopeptide (TPR) repeat protein
MTIQASLLRQLNNPNLSRDGQADLRCQTAKQFEERGNYEAAREAMGELWQGIGEHPNIAGLERSIAGEVLLRAGVLTGWIGDKRQIENSQEMAKNLISQSIAVFESLSFPKKILEARIELSVCYWREGAYDDARVILQGVLDQLTTDSELRAKAVLRRAIVERSAMRFSDSLRILTDYALLFKKINSHLVKGGYHNALGLVLKNLAEAEKREDYIDRAFVEYEAASFHFEEAKHMPYCAHVENNLGFLFLKAGRLKDAHRHLDRARRIFSNLKDRCSVAQVDDTRARALLAQGRNSEAEKVSRSAVNALEKGGRQSLFAEALTTHGITLARLSHYEQARFTLQRAIEVAHQSDAYDDAGIAALTLLEELSGHLTADEMQTIYERAVQWLAKCQDPRTLQRLYQAAARVLSVAQASKVTEGKGSTANVKELGKRYKLGEMVRRYEHDLIEQALISAETKVTRAARLLGISYQGLAYMLEHRHKDLLPKRSPKKQRLKSKIKQPPSRT